MSAVSPFDRERMLGPGHRPALEWNSDRSGNPGGLPLKESEVGPVRRDSSRFHVGALPLAPNLR